MRIGSLVLLVLLFSFSNAQAQVTYELSPDSHMDSGCTGPSMCLCPVLMVGFVTGTFDLTLVPLSLGPIFEYDVTDVDWVVNAGLPDEMIVTGSGVYLANLSDGSHEMTLDLEVDGIPQQFTTGPVGGAAGFPDELSIGIYAPVSICVYDGFVFTAATVSSQPEFDRGDCNTDGVFDVADAVVALYWLFTPGTSFPPCDDACDANDDGGFDISDPVYGLAALFTGGPVPPEPYGECGTDPTPDGLGCMEFSSCP